MGTVLLFGIPWPGRVRVLVGTIARWLNTRQPCATVWGLEPEAQMWVGWFLLGLPSVCRCPGAGPVCVCGLMSFS